MSLFDDLDKILRRCWGEPSAVGQRESEWALPAGTIRLIGDLEGEPPEVWLSASTSNEHATAQWKVTNRESLNRAAAKTDTFIYSNQEF